MTDKSKSSFKKVWLFEGLKEIFFFDFYWDIIVVVEQMEGVFHVIEEGRFIFCLIKDNFIKYCIFL